MTVTRQLFTYYSWYNRADTVENSLTALLSDHSVEWVRNYAVRLLHNSNFDVSDGAKSTTGTEYGNIVQAFK